MSGPAVEAQPGAWRFDAHTAFEDDRLGGWRARIDPDLGGFGGTMGGYVAALALRAMTSLVSDPERTPRSLATQLLAATQPGTVELHPRLERSGSTMTTTSLRLDQEGATVASALASFGRPRPSRSYNGVSMPDVPAPEHCRPIAQKPLEDGVSLLVEHRPAAPPLPFTGSESAEILVWMRLGEDRPVDALSAAMLADAAPPALFAHLTEFVAMPSTDITVHFGDLAAAEASPWLLGSFRTRRAAEGYAVEDGELWTPGGALVLETRQLRRILG